MLWFEGFEVIDADVDGMRVHARIGGQAGEPMEDGAVLLVVVDAQGIAQGQAVTGGAAFPRRGAHQHLVPWGKGPLQGAQAFGAVAVVVAKKNSHAASSAPSSSLS